MSVTCLNCATEFTGKYCPNCGQKHGAAMPSAKDVIGDLMRSAFSPSGRMFETLVTLFRKPGEVTRAYLAGQRELYVHPVRVYLLAIFLFVGAISANNAWRTWRGEPQFEAASAQLFARKPASDANEKATETPSKNANENAASTSSAADEKPRSKSYDAGEAIGRTAKETLPPWLVAHIQKRAEKNGNETREQIEARAMRAMTQNYSFLFALLVPIMAWVNWMLYAGRGITYGAHFVFILHTTAGGCLILMLPYIFNAPLAYFPLSMVSLVWQMASARRAFSVSWWGAIWRYLIFLVPSMFFSLALGIITAFAVTVFG